MPQLNMGEIDLRNDKSARNILHSPMKCTGLVLTNLAFATFARDDVWLSWKFFAEERMRNLRHTNDVIGAYVTAGARIHLYGYLHRLRENAIYFDTDSVIFIHSSAEKYPTAPGDKLGHMQSELNPQNTLSNS